MDDIPKDQETSAPDSSVGAGDERRMVHRLMTYWREISDNTALPNPEALKESEIPDVWPYRCFMDIGAQNDPVIRSVGEEIARAADMDLLGRHISEAGEIALIHHALGYASEVVRKRVPVSRGGSFVNGDGQKVLFRSIILPLSEDRTSVSTLFGAANWTVATDS